MIATTKYKKWQLVMELITLGAAVCWFITGLVLYFNYVPAEQILKHNMLIYSLIFTAFVYLGFSVITILPADNGLIKTKKYIDGSHELRYGRESALRSVFLWVKLICLLLCVLLGTFCYLPDIAAFFAQNA